MEGRVTITFRSEITSEGLEKTIEMFFGVKIIKKERLHDVSRCNGKAMHFKKLHFINLDQVREEEEGRTY